MSSQLFTFNLTRQLDSQDPKIRRWESNLSCFKHVCVRAQCFSNMSNLTSEGTTVWISSKSSKGSLHDLPGPWAHFQCQASADTETCSTCGKPELDRHLKWDTVSWLSGNIRVLWRNILKPVFGFIARCYICQSVEPKTHNLWADWPIRHSWPSLQPL